MIRPLALFLAVGFLTVAGFLLLPDDVPGPPASAGSTWGVDGGRVADARGSRASIVPAHPRAAAPAPARLEPRRYADVVPKEQLVVEVVREDGRAIANAAVRFLNLGVALDAVTDANGRACFEAQPETSAFVTITGAGFYAHNDVLALEPGVRRIVVRNRKMVVAQVLVRGQTPREPVRIGYQLPMNIGALSALSDAQGRVEFFNLPQGVDGTFTWPEGYRRDENSVRFCSGLPGDDWKTAERAAIWMGHSLPTEAAWQAAVKAGAIDTEGWVARNVNVQFQLQAAAALTLPHNGTPAEPAQHPEGGPALVGTIRVEGNTSSLDEAVQEISRRIDEIHEAMEPQSAVPLVTLITRLERRPNLMKVLGAASEVPEIRLIPIRAVPIRILDPSGAAVAGFVQVRQGWCSCNPTNAEGLTTLALDEDVYASGLSSVLEAHLSSTGAVLPIENVSMTWNAAGAPSATVTVGYPPSTPEPVVVDVIDDQQK